MPRISPVNDIVFSLEELPGAGTMSMLFRIMAHRPEIMQLSVQLLEATMRSGTVDSKLKELLAVRVSQVNHCVY